MIKKQPIGIFDSGYGGLTVFRAIADLLPQYDYVYLGDNARAPYGNRSFNTIHQYTWECVQMLFDMGCPLVILACNTASAKALRTIQQRDLLNEDPAKRVLGVIRPTAEVIGNYSDSKEIGVLGTKGTVQSGSYLIEINNFFPDVKVYQQACPLWVPLIENGEYDQPGADYFVKKYLDQVLAQSANIDTLLLACTHYPLLLEKIKDYLPEGIKVVPQGDIVAASLRDYLQRHPEMEQQLSANGTQQFFTTSDDTMDFDHHASIFFGERVTSEFIALK
ncbi:glutamate racemase [Mucilaginibacter ginsenosidivorans]|uniref:Glutamate racemase n=1 Tax=Mucilaginibacter ginsenosidivorans TaxID=398053 RepID=A0A5B8V176_9SPHI|nr:glutamate racemase [Mucilaginibacter ginsenosidivorans]QEC65022.1 glutamate racemase [Mucilaginibacter ginsenosidivorans]